MFLTSAANIPDRERLAQSFPLTHAHTKLCRSVGRKGAWSSEGQPKMQEVSAVRPDTLPALKTAPLILCHTRTGPTFGFH